MVSKNAGSLPGPIGMGLGMLEGFLKANINKVPADKLKEELRKNAEMMLSWISEDGTVDSE